VAYEILLLAAAFPNGVADHQADGAQHVIGRHEAVTLAKILQPADGDAQGGPAATPQQRRELLVERCALRQAGDAVEQRAPGGAAQRVADAQAQLLNVERLGDVVDDAQLQTLQLVDAVAFFRQEDDRGILGRVAGAQAAADFVAVDIRQVDVQDDQVGIVAGGQVKGLLAAGGGQHGVALHAQVSRQHPGQVAVILNNQNLGFIGHRCCSPAAPGIAGRALVRISAGQQPPATMAGGAGGWVPS